MIAFRLRRLESSSSQTLTRVLRGACAAVVLTALSFTVSAQNTQDTLQALKDSLSPDQQSSILQDVLGGKGAGGTKSDQKLKTPETVIPTSQEQLDLLRKGKKEKTRDERILRQADEDPELRADDTVMIEMRSVEDICKRSGVGLGGPNAINDPNNPNPQTQLNPLTSPDQLGGNAALPNLAALTGANQNNPANKDLTTGVPIDYSRCPLPTDQPKTDREKEQEEKFRQRIVSKNPYKLNRFGVLELPGLPAIPLAGLTASEATRRLAADPDFNDNFVRLVLLRLNPLGQEALKPFGYDLFQGVPSTFAPVSDIQVPVDYIVGPGDTLNIQLYGNESQNYELTVRRDGRINFPKLGPIMVSGMSFDAAREAVQDRVSKQLIGMRVSVTMGDLRSIRVFVLGEAEKPGSYTVSGLSTMTNALFVSGGVKKIGSLRKIQLKRDGRLVTTLDLYDLLLHGNTSGDKQLLPGDVIFIPPIGRTISVYGAVRRPAIYELKNETSAEEAVEIAGGLGPDADASGGQLERIRAPAIREVQNVNLFTPSGRATPLDDGDKLRFPEIRPQLVNSVTLSGYVFRPGLFEYRAGLRLSDVLNDFDELKPEADIHYIMIRREVPPEERIEVLSADLQKALAARRSPADPELRPRDEIIVFNLAASRERILQPILRDLELQATPDRPQQVVSVDGRVKAPGRYPLEPTMHVSDLIRAGGSFEDAAYQGQAELTRYAVVDGDMRQTELIEVNLPAIRRGDRSADLALRPYDALVIKPVPMWMEPGIIEVVGEVRFPGKYPIHQGETLHSVLLRAGGFTNVAFPDGAVFVREELKKREKDQLELLATRLQNDLAALSLKAVATTQTGAAGAAGGAAATQGLLVGQQLLQQLRTAKPVGRLVINLESVLNDGRGNFDDVLVKDGDKLIVPKKTQDITILGEVQSPTSHVFEPGLTRDDYIAKSGGTTQNADRKRIYVVRANGDVLSGGRSGWFRRTQSTEIRPGDTIVVPLDTERIPALPLWTAITTIIYNLAIGAILIHQNL